MIPVTLALRARRTPRLLATAALAAGALMAAQPGHAAAQAVVGTVREAGTARPLEGVFIVLVDDDGQRLNGVLSGEAGAFTLRAPAAGRYRLVAELIGYGSTETEPLVLGPGPALRHDIEVSVQAITLDAISVEAGERCQRQPGSGPATARLWEEARKALEVARWGGERGVFRFLVVSHTRVLDARSLRVQSQETRPERRFYEGSPYGSIPADELTEHGYVREDEDGNWDYFAPDAEVLLSDGFLDSHCFGVAEAPRDEPELVGLRFEPVPERELPDVSGVLWLERGTAELRRVDYVYENLPFRHADWSAVGGRIVFERLATGAWIVRRWHIRMPHGARNSGGRIELLTLIEQGAEVRQVTTASGRVLAEALGATLQGVVTASPGGDGIEGAVVEIPTLGRTTTTGPDGAFRLTGLAGGTFDVRVTDPAFQVPPDQPLDRTVSLRPGAAARLVVALERRPPLPGGVIAGDDGPEWSNAVVGRVVTDAGWAPVVNAVARLLGPGGEVVLATMVTDARGRFRFDHPGGGADFVLEIEHPDFQTFRRGVRFGATDELEVEVALRRR